MATARSNDACACPYLSGSQVPVAVEQVRGQRRRGVVVPALDVRKDPLHVRPGFLQLPGPDQGSCQVQVGLGDPAVCGVAVLEHPDRAAGEADGLDVVAAPVVGPARFITASAGNCPSEPSDISATPANISSARSSSRASRQARASRLVAIIRMRGSAERPNSSSARVKSVIAARFWPAKRCIAPELSRTRHAPSKSGSRWVAAHAAASACCHADSSRSVE